MHSMTGFGRGSHATDKIVARVEASSVNRKQGEVSFHMPRTLAELEPGLRKAVLSRISRGRKKPSVACTRFRVPALGRFNSTAPVPKRCSASL